MLKNMSILLLLLFIFLLCFIHGKAADVDQETINHFFSAVRGNDPDAVREILGRKDYKSSLLNLRLDSQGGQTPLMAACLAGADKVAKVLLEEGADVNIGEKDGYTPMHGAAFQGRAKVAKVLITHGLNPSDMHEDGYTPLHRAAWGREKRHTDMAAVLLKAGVSPTEPSRDGRTALEMTTNEHTAKLLKDWTKKSSDSKEGL